MVPPEPDDFLEAVGDIDVGLVILEEDPAARLLRALRMRLLLRDFFLARSASKYSYIGRKSHRLKSRIFVPSR